MMQQLVEAGLVHAYGSTCSRTYTLSADIYQAKGEQVAYTRQAGFSKLQHEQMVLNHVRHHGRIRRSETIELCHLGPHQASRLLGRLKDENKLVQHGERRGAYYTIGPSA